MASTLYVQEDFIGTHRKKVINSLTKALQPSVSVAQISTVHYTDKHSHGLEVENQVQQRAQKTSLRLGKHPMHLDPPTHQPFSQLRIQQTILQNLVAAVGESLYTISLAISASTAVVTSTELSLLRGL